jgi:cell division topological specificity factor
MNFFDYFRFSRPSQSTASIAKERLQIIVAHERGSSRGGAPDFIPLLQQEILQVVRKYLPIDDEQIKVSMDRNGEYEVLELNITLPETRPPRSAR